MGHAFDQKGILSQLLLSAALAAPLAPVAAQTAPTPRAPQVEQFPEWVQPFLYNKSNQPKLKPTITSTLFVIKDQAATPETANAKLDAIIAGPSKANISALYPKYAPYAEDCLGTIKKDSSTIPLREKFQNCLYDTTVLNRIILEATVHTDEQAVATGLSKDWRNKLPACQKEYGITPTERANVGFIPAAMTTMCLNR